MKKLGLLFLFAVVFLALFNCDNPWMEEILEAKTITFDSNGGSFVPSQTVYKDKKIIEPPPPVRAGYVFDGWYTDNDTFEGRWYFDNRPDGDMTLYAKWRYTGIEVTGITVESQPNKLVYNHGERLDLAGLKVKLSYDDGEPDIIAVEDFSDSFTTDPMDGVMLSVMEHNDRPVIIKYGSHKTETGYLAVRPIAPQLEDFTISGTGTFVYDGIAKTVTVNPNKDGMGEVTVKYNNDASAPINAGTYNITFDVAEGTNYTAASNLQAENLTINRAMPTKDDFNFGNLEQTAGFVSAVTITPNDNKFNGAEITIYYYNSNNQSLSGLPTNPGTYRVTFNVEEADNWYSASGLEAGTLRINSYFSSVDVVGEYLNTLPPTAPDEPPYDIALKISNDSELAALSAMLKAPENAGKLVNLDLSDSEINTIGLNTFLGCTTLAGITLPDSVTSIGSNAFNGCSSLTGITMNKVEIIGESAFFGCESLASVTIPDYVHIETQAFIGCDSLNTVTLGKGIAFDDGIIFPGNLVEKYNSTDTANPGGEGTYIRSTDGTDTVTWIKQSSSP